MTTPDRTCLHAALGMLTVGTLALYAGMPFAAQVAGVLALGLLALAWVRR